MEIVWTNLAETSLYNILKYINSNFGANVAFQTRILIQKSAEDIGSFPNMGKVEYVTNSNIQIRSLVVKKSKIFYYIDGDYIIIFLIWDTRGNPETLRELINMI